MLMFLYAQLSFSEPMRIIFNDTQLKGQRIWLNSSGVDEMTDKYSAIAATPAIETNASTGFQPMLGVFCEEGEMKILILQAPYFSDLDGDVLIRFDKKTAFMTRYTKMKDNYRLYDTEKLLEGIKKYSSLRVRIFHKFAENLEMRFSLKGSTESINNACLKNR